MVQYLRDQVIACLCEWVRTQAWNLFEFLGWGGIAAIVAGLFLLSAICSRFSATLGRPLPMLLASGIIAGGLYFMVKGWNNPASPAILANKAPAHAPPMVTAPMLLADAAPDASPPDMPPPPVQPFVPVNVQASQPHEVPAHHATAQHGEHTQVTHLAMSGHHAGTSQMASGPVFHASGGGHTPLASGGTVHASAGHAPGVAAPASKPSPAAAPSPPAKAVRPVKSVQPSQGTASVASVPVHETSPTQVVHPSPSKPSQAVAARQAFLRRRAEAEGVDAEYGSAMLRAYGGSPHPLAGNHPAGVHHPSGHLGTMHHPNGHR